MRGVRRHIVSSKNRLLQQRCSASKSLEAGSRRCLVVDKRSVGLFDKGCNLGEDNNSYLSCAPCFIFIDNSFSMRSSAANIIYFCSCKVIQKSKAAIRSRSGNDFRHFSHLEYELLTQCPLVFPTSLPVTWVGKKCGKRAYSRIFGDSREKAFWERERELSRWEHHPTEELRDCLWTCRLCRQHQMEDEKSPFYP